MGESDDSNVAIFRLTATVAQARVRTLAINSANLRWTRHIREQMEARGIDAEDVLRILRTGDVETEPRTGKFRGEWKVKLTRKLSNGRVAGVVTLIVNDSYLRLLTTEWEDHR
jgi:hypothetical protein